jgi:antitoxin (DNA-binding transcriptional repressor) of toxin-antitoxin stability system
MIIDTDHLLPISEANAKGISKLATDAESGHEWVLLRNSKPVAAVVGMSKMQRLQELEELEEDLRLMAITLARTLTDNGNRTSFDKVLAHFGLDEDDLVGGD